MKLFFLSFNAPIVLIKIRNNYDRIINMTYLLHNSIGDYAFLNEKNGLNINAY